MRDRQHFLPLHQPLRRQQRLSSARQCSDRGQRIRSVHHAHRLTDLSQGLLGKLIGVFIASSQYLKGYFGQSGEFPPSGPQWGEIVVDSVRRHCFKSPRPAVADRLSQALRAEPQADRCGI